MKNYKLIERKYLENEQSEALVFEHDATKAKVFVMSNEDDNKTFGIGFRTPPKNSTGVCHILEHCVLNGSKKYRTREPFMDMVKGSLQTFLNAITYSDKTIYPVASRNDKDFHNLMDLYLDAVFNPKVKEDKKIFMQEGWRYHLEDDKLTYKGVVYNEMRGAMSSPERQVIQNAETLLLPDTIYAYNSGGDPYEIPKLEYDEFIAYYDEFYHPSNSYIFLYGNMDYEETLEYIHDEYLSEYDFREVNSTLDYQDKFTETKYETAKFNTTNDINPKDSFVTYSVLTGKGNDAKDRLMADLVSSVTIDNESSTLRQKLFSLGILDAIINVSSTTLETSFAVLVKNIDVKDRDLFVNTLEEELRNIVKNGIDKEIVLTELNSYKFNIREKENFATKGIIYFMKAFDSWLYDSSPIEAIDISEKLKYIEENIDNGIFEKYIEERILNNTHKLIASHLPEKGLNDKKDKELQKNLDDKLEKLSIEEKEALENQRVEMDIFQNRENTAEEKATIPMLSKSDVNTKIERIDRKVEEKEGYTLLTHNLATSGIDYITMMFDINHITSKEDILYASLLSDMLTYLDTEKYNYSDLNKKIYIETGGIYTNITQSENNKTKKINRYMKTSIKVFSENIKNAVEVIVEVLKNTKFENESRLKEILLQIKAKHDISLYSGAHALMMARALSNHHEFYNYAEYINGIEYRLFIKQIVEKDEKEVLKKLEEVYKKIFTKNNLIVDIASDFTNKNELIESFDSIVSNFENKQFEYIPFEFVPKVKKEGFATSADVNYVSIGNITDKEYDSKLLVVDNLLSNEYLYSEIRAKGGAYGAGMKYSEFKTFVTYSYRDPNLQNTLNVYDNIPNYLENIDISEEDLLPYIIGAVGRLDPARTEQQKASMDLGFYLSQRDYAEFEELLENSLNSNVSQLKQFAPLLREQITNPSLAILGNKSIIEENKEIFDEIIEL